MIEVLIGGGALKNVASVPDMSTKSSVERNLCLDEISEVIYLVIFHKYYPGFSLETVREAIFQTLEELYSRKDE